MRRRDLIAMLGGAAVACPRRRIAWPALSLPLVALLCMRFTGVLAALVVFALTAGRAAALELVVAKAQGINLAPGEVVDGSKPLALLGGQSVILLSSSGQIVKLLGPSDAAPESGLDEHAETSDLSSAMTKLITERKPRFDMRSVIRATAEVALPDPWVVDVTHPGTSCIQSNQSVMLWRSEDLSATPVTLAPMDRDWTVSGMWLAGANQLSLPATITTRLRDHTVYVVERGEKVAPVILRLIPASVNNDAMRAGFMTAVGCDRQVDALLAQYQRIGPAQ